MTYPAWCHFEGIRTLLSCVSDSCYITQENIAIQICAKSCDGKKRLARNDYMLHCAVWSFTGTYVNFISPAKPVSPYFLAIAPPIRPPTDRSTLKIFTVFSAVFSFSIALAIYNKHFAVSANVVGKTLWQPETQTWYYMDLQLIFHSVEVFCRY